MSEQRNERVETILDDPALALKAKREDGMEGIPTLRPAYYENNPRLVVRTKVPNDKNHGMIDAKMSNRAFFAVLNALEHVAKSEQPTVLFMDNKGHRFVDKKRDPNPSIMSVIKMEKNNEGVISICISAGNNRPRIEFPFIDEDYHNFRDANGPMPVSLASRLYCLGWIDTMREYVGTVIEKTYTRPAWMDRGNQQGGGNWNNNNRGGGNGGGNSGGNWNNNNRPNNNQQNSNSGGGGNWNNGNNSSNNRPSGGSDFSFDDDIPL